MGGNFHRNTQNVFHHFNLIEDDSGSGKIIPHEKMLGYKQLDEKGAFIDNWHVSYTNYGEHYGYGLAKSENNFILDKIKSNSIRKDEINIGEVSSTLLNLLKSQEHNDFIIFMNFDFEIDYPSVVDSLGFKHSWIEEAHSPYFKKIQGYKGFFKIDRLSVHAFKLWDIDQIKEHFLLIINPKNNYKWIQQSPITKSENCNYQKNIFLIKISDLSNDNVSRNQVITDNPSWLQQYDDKDRYLKQHVIVNIFENFKFEILNKKACNYIVVKGIKSP